MEDEEQAPLCAPGAALVGYTFVRHVGFILDELSSQGLDLWRDERRRWHWRWMGTTCQSQRGFWAIGEAVVDAVVTRWPRMFDVEGSDGRDADEDAFRRAGVMGSANDLGISGGAHIAREIGCQKVLGV